MSPEELQKLGLPATHVHFSNVNKQLTASADRQQQQQHTEELLAPSDIKVTYSGKWPMSSLQIVNKQLTFFKNVNKQLVSRKGIQSFFALNFEFLEF